ncbi:RagB/SusD family nutrient uptake outer membrane protein [Chitinophaga sp. sic0106]|uniref:RagB/SusD family nutrient uptake outer membrane protein n=1 Tax=Chitinophaga sp. sic0106 TaxID=2854785 RepID=UPI001C44C86B|nr:RagB/SusD family nutrient uptake outer membrane protein [Chitinophaga sp. sic0106]MBV7532317.1 RagB/SusD family nutrient uptake outer membrane protein [Chitinophaga sp. sic0106]
MKLRNIICVSLLLGASFSCKKVIDIKETDIIGGDIALKTVDNCEAGVIGAYSALSTNMDILFNAVLADEVKVAEFYNSATVHEWQFSTADVVIRDNFTALTSNGVIADRVNRVLAALPKADSLKVSDGALRLKLQGECLFLRAWSHFELFRYYCDNYGTGKLGMAYMEKTSLSPQARIPMEEYFKKLTADLAAAKSLVPNNLDDRNRINRATVSGMQARVALYMKDWANAEAYATEYISLLPLATKAEFPGIWTDANTAEVSYRIVRTTALDRLGSLWRGVSTAPGGVINIGQISWVASGKLFGSFDQTNDVRFNAYLTNEKLLSDAGRPSNLIKKYAGSAYATGNENVNNAKVFRTGEMYLIRAEARAELNKVSGANSAESDLNDLRAARITGYTNVTLAGKDQAIAAIMSERFKELAYEGHRYWDLKRRGLGVDRDAADAPNAAGQKLAAGNFRFTLPIPQTEMNANRLMVQNDGYK